MTDPAAPPPPLPQAPPPLQSGERPLPGRLIAAGFVAFVLAVVLGALFLGALAFLAVATLVIGIMATVRRQTAVGVTLIVCGIVAIPVVLLLATSYRVPSPSMLPTLDVGDHVAANRFINPGVGDIVVFHPPGAAETGTGGRGPSGQCGVDYGGGKSCPAAAAEKADVKFIKRIVAGPGDTVALREGHVILNGKSQADDEEGEITPCHPGDDCDFPTPITVPPGQYFMLGDNRGQSDDSRYWGPVPKDWIIGVVFVRSLPIGRFAFL